MMAAKTKGSKSQYKVLSGLCPDEHCGAKLFFPAYDSSIECSGCGQRHQQSALKNVEDVKNPDVALHNILRNILIGNSKPKKGSDSVKVLGLSNYQCKLISPLLTKYGMDKQSGKAKLLTEMGQGEIFDCSVLGDRNFLIEPEHVEVVGYGRDRTGSMKYLKDTLTAIKSYNNAEECLLPIHADGDGHCLVHAVSRALIGRELFWHALRENLRKHLETRLEDYMNLFGDFVDRNEWHDIIAECDPEFIPLNGEGVGLRNIHIFGLANVLKRPIILLDSISGIKSSGDYSGVFLPGLQPPEACRSKDGKFHKPMCLAWSSSGRNHYIALVAVKGRPLPRLPPWLIPQVWGMHQGAFSQYVDLDSKGCLVVGGDKSLQDRYVLKLVNAMEEVFVEKYGISTSLVADMHQYVFKSSGVIGVKPEDVLEQAQRATAEKRLYRCLTCDAITEWSIVADWLRPGGSLYKLAISSHGTLDPSKHYSFPTQGLVCSYDEQKDELIVEKSRSALSLCQFCQGTQVRILHGDGTIEYKNGDRTSNRASKSRCQCGFKHYWDSKEYDNLPEMFPVSLEWGGKVIAEKVVWFQYESDLDLNSNVYEVAQQIVQKHFPGEFGSERLVQRVVDTILRQTAPPKTAEEEKQEAEDGAHAGTDASWRADMASKIILSGHMHKTTHKEDLGKSKAEKDVKKAIESKGPQMQKRKTDQLTKQQEKERKGSPIKASPKQQKVTKQDKTHSTDSMCVSLPSSPAKTSPSGKKKVRVTTSDSRQLMLSLDPDTTYHQLTDMLAKELGVPVERQKIKHGFPPKELQPPAEDEDNEPLPIQHGDRVTVVIVPNHQEPQPSTSVPDNQPLSRRVKSSQESPAGDSAAFDILKSLTDSLQDSGDGLDTSIRSLALMAGLMGKDLWTYVQGMSHLFSAGGLYYKQIERDLGLVDGKHCALPSLPGKVFQYNAKHERLELCLEPHGHYPVEPGVEERVLKLPLSEKAKEAQPESLAKTLGSDASGVFVNRAMKKPSVYVPFSGEGHSLQSSDHSEQPAEPKTVNNVVEAEPPESTTSTREALFRRVGPGYTVLDHQKSNEINQQTDTLINTMADQIQAIVKDRGLESEDVVEEQLEEVSSGPVLEVDVSKTEEPMDTT